MSTSAPAPHVRRRPLILAALTALALMLIVASPWRAAANDLGDVFSNWSDRSGGRPPVEIALHATDSDDRIQQFEYVTVTAHWDLTGLEPDAGDEFTLALPEEFTIDAETFGLSTPEGTELGQCTTQARAERRAAEVTCTVTDSEYLLSHEAIKGRISMDMQAVERTEASGATFVTSGGSLEVPLPGSGIADPHRAPVPTDVSLVGWFDSERVETHWRLIAPGALAGGGPLHLSMRVPDGLDLDRVRIVAVEATPEGWSRYEDGERIVADAADVRWSPGGSEVTATAAEPSPSLVYVLEVDALLAEPPQRDGVALTTTGEAAGRSVEHAAVMHDRGAGQGAGVER